MTEVRRDSSIELLRMLFMMGVCLIHTVSQGGYNKAWVSNILSPSVVGFAFISGWFGVRFSFKKVWHLYGISLWAATVFALYAKYAANTSFVDIFWGVILDSWFLHAYVVLMVSAPILNIAVEKLHWTAVLPFVGMVFGWGFAHSVPLVGRYVPTTAGLTAYSGLTLCGIYVVARLFRMHDIFVFIKTPVAWAVFLVALVLCACGAGDYNSPTALLLAMSAFRLVSMVKLNERLAGAVLLLSPSLFFVYLVHGHKYFYHLERGSLGAIESFMIDKFQLPIPFVWLATAVVIFVVAVICDIPRRWLYAKLIRK